MLSMPRSQYNPTSPIESIFDISHVIAEAAAEASALIQIAKASMQCRFLLVINTHMAHLLADAGSS